MSTAATPVPSRRPRLALLLGGLAMFGPFSIDTVFPAFPDIAAEYGVGELAMQQTISVYLVAYALMSVLHGPLSDARGRKPVIFGGISVFALASIGCALATSFEALLAFRALQGMSAGAGLIVGRAIIRDLHNGPEAQRLMSQVTMIFGVAPALAPIVGGWILLFSDWHGIFWFLLAFALLLLAGSSLALPETHPPENRTPLSARGLLRGYRSILGNRQFVLLALAGSFNFGALFLYIASAPAFVMGLLGLGPQQFAWFFVPAILGMMSGAWLSGRLAGRLTGAQCASLGFAVCGVAAASNLGYNLSVDALTAPWAVLPVALNAFGIALVFPILTLAILDMYPRQRGAASSMQSFVSLSSHALVAGLLSPLVSHSGLALATTAAVFSLIGWLLWRVHRRSCRVEPPSEGRGPVVGPEGAI